MVTMDESYQEITGTDDRMLKRQYWEVAKGLQAVDGLKTSAYLDSLIDEALDEEYATPQVIEKLNSYYHTNGGADTADAHETTREADYVATRIEYLLEQQESFIFSPVTLKYIHKELFKDVLPFDWVGNFREVNISKAEDILCGKSVSYAPYPQILEQLEYDFADEQNALYSYPFEQEQIKQVAGFTSKIWETHPFREGNTRTIAVFIIQYLGKLGYQITNEPFQSHSRYFRAALVRSLYENKRFGVKADSSYLIKFFENALLCANHRLSLKELACLVSTPHSA